MISQSSCDRSPPHDHDKWRARKMDARYCPLSVCRLQVVYLMTTPTPRRDATGQDATRLDARYRSIITDINRRIAWGLPSSSWRCSRPWRTDSACGCQPAAARRPSITANYADRSCPRNDDDHQSARTSRQPALVCVSPPSNTKAPVATYGVTSTFACCRAQFVGPITAPPGEILRQVHC